MSGMKSAHHSSSHSALQPHHHEIMRELNTGPQTTTANTSSISVTTQPQDKPKEIQSYSSIYQHHQNAQNKMRSGDQRHVVLDQINRPASRNAGARKTGTGRSRKGNMTVTNGNSNSHSQDSRPTLPQVQMQKSTSGQLAYNQLGESKANPNSNSATNLP